EREFQNMFTFSRGFEAATLKIPNKDSTAYNGATNTSLNSGASPPPRKQIIGFAKFATRADALHARDVLQSKRVDMDKPAVLKAEMAKKNLHTKRGVGGAQSTTTTSGQRPYGPMPRDHFESDLDERLGRHPYRNIDQNPPINTLYVGNLPTTASSSTANALLEESLRVAFSKCAGFRKLCFRQKSNGPMCFVEFDDVQFATQAMHDMYGNTLNGLIKNGIRLSYSKNPLGVR
ncbi:hypothetical protein DL93DRAFT_2028544, partial [Clavulina sp. PMI_390]